MTQRVAGTGIGNARRAQRLLEHTLYNGFMKMMAAPLSGLRILIYPRRRKNPLPPPLSARVRILEIQRARQLDPPRTVGDVAFVLCRNPKSTARRPDGLTDRKSTRLNSSHSQISYAV